MKRMVVGDLVKMTSSPPHALDFLPPKIGMIVEISRSGTDSYHALITFDDKTEWLPTNVLEVINERN